MSKKQKRYGDGTAFFQKEFSNSEFLRFARIFGCDGSERFRCAVLFTRLVPAGFLLTDKAVHFEDGTKIDFTGGSFQNENVKISSETFFNATLGVLKIEADGFFKEYYFKNTNILALDALVAFLKGAFAGNTVENYDFSMTFKIVKANKILNAFGVSLDKVLAACNSIEEKIEAFQENINQKLNQHKEKRKEKAQTEKTEPPEDAPIKVLKKYRPNLFVQTLDFIASMLFITSFIFVLKPELFMEYEFIGIPEDYKFLEHFGPWVLYFKAGVGELTLASLILEILLILICLVSFFILKLITIFANRRWTQILAFLMLLLTLTATLLLKEKMILLIAVVVVCYFLFEILIGERASTAFKKLLALTITGIVEYMVLNFTMNGITKNLSAELVNSLAIRGLQWW